MSKNEEQQRIDVAMLANAINEKLYTLESNPAELVPDFVINNLLHKAVNEVIEKYFSTVIIRKMQKMFKDEFKTINDDYVRRVVYKLIKDDGFKDRIKTKLKDRILGAL